MTHCHEQVFSGLLRQVPSASVRAAELLQLFGKLLRVRLGDLEDVLVLQRDASELRAVQSLTEHFRQGGAPRAWGSA